MQGMFIYKYAVLHVYLKQLLSHSGRYAYIETSSPRRYGQKARLISGPFSGVQCLEFAYSMVGSTIGKLSVYHLVHGTEMETWSKEGRQRGSYWHTDNITLYGNNYYVSPKKTLKTTDENRCSLVSYR